jgi:hypothetical protein
MRSSTAVSSVVGDSPTVARIRERSHQTIDRDPYFLSGVVSGVSLESTTKTANRLAGSLSLAFSLIR